jgi:hypothetical protein
MLRRTGAPPRFTSTTAVSCCPGIGLQLRMPLRLPGSSSSHYCVHQWSFQQLCQGHAQLAAAGAVGHPTLYSMGAACWPYCSHVSCSVQESPRLPAGGSNPTSDEEDIMDVMEVAAGG